MGDGRRASPSCRPWKSRKTRFRTGRVLSLCQVKGDLHSLRGWWRGGGLCVCVCVCPASPFSSPQHSEAALSFHFCTPLKSFLFRECVQRAMQLSEGYRSTAAQRKLKGLWLLSRETAQRLELKGGICGLFFFPTRKEVPRLPHSALLRPYKLQVTHKKDSYGVSSLPAAASSCVALRLPVTYLHSPFPFGVASHLPPLRHASVGREHLRPVECINKYIDQNMFYPAQFLCAHRTEMSTLGLIGIKLQVKSWGNYPAVKFCFLGCFFFF